MRLRSAPSAVVLTLVLLAAAASSARPAGATRDQAQPAPDFSLEPHDGGRSLSLSDLRGKVTLLYFWFPT